MSDGDGQYESASDVFDLASERTVIGAFLRDTPGAEVAVGGSALADVTLADFYGPGNRRLMEVVFALRAAGARAGVAAVLDRLVDDGMLEAAGGAAAIRAAVDDRGDLPRAIQIVIGMGKVRRLLHATEDITDAILRDRPRDHPDRW